MDNIFALTETEFFRQLAERSHENIHIAYQDFVLQVHNLCHTGANQKSCVISALLVAEIDLAHLKNDTEREQVNHQLTSFISKAIHFVQNKLLHLKDTTVIPTEDDEVIQGIDLTWTQKKVGLVELGYAFKLANCFGKHVSAAEIIRKLAKLFRVELPDNYACKKYNEMKVRARESRTYFLDFLKDMLTTKMESDDEK